MLARTICLLSPALCELRVNAGVMLDDTDIGPCHDRGFFLPAGLSFSHYCMYIYTVMRGGYAEDYSY